RGVGEGLPRPRSSAPGGHHLRDGHRQGPAAGDGLGSRGLLRQARRPGHALPGSRLTIAPTCPRRRGRSGHKGRLNPALQSVGEVGNCYGRGIVIRSGSPPVNENQSQTESLLDIVRSVKNETLLLPEFQRDFRWEMDQTYDLFDSLIREI